MYWLLKRLLLAWLFFTASSNTVFADNTLSATLDLSPKICITSADEDTCNTSIVLNWTRLKLRPICIISDYQALKKWCNDAKNINSLTLNVSTKEDIQFVLIDKNTRETLAGVKLKVTQASPPQVRRRYRNPWSLF